LPLAFRPRRPAVSGRWLAGILTINDDTQNRRVLVLNEPDRSVREAITKLLQVYGWQVVEAGSCREILSATEDSAVVAVISESNLPDCAAQDILDLCSGLDLPVVFTGHDTSLQGAVDLIRQGAVDFLDKPFPQTRLTDLLNNLRNRQNENPKYR